MKNTFLIRVYGDSLGMPREAEGISCAATYPELVRDELERVHPEWRVSVFNRSRGGISIREQFEQFVVDTPYFGSDPNAILIVQCGIVDCAPRPLPPSVRERLARMPKPVIWLVAKVLHYLRPWLLCLGFRWRQTDEEQFRAVLEQWLSRAQRAVGRVYVITIAPTTDFTAAHSPGLRSSIEAYNRLIRDVVESAASTAVRLIDVHAAINGMGGNIAQFINERDGHHITESGHRLYARLIAEQVDTGAAGNVSVPGRAIS